MLTILKDWIANRGFMSNNVNGKKKSFLIANSIRPGTISWRIYIDSLGFTGGSLVEDTKEMLVDTGHWTGNINSSLSSVFTDVETPSLPEANFKMVGGDLVVFFNSSSSTATELPLTYLWDFGDTESSTDASPTHVYATEGLKTISLTITDNIDNSDEFIDDITLTESVTSKNVILKEWNWALDDIGEGDTYNTWEPTGTITQALAGYIGVLDPLWGLGEEAPDRPVDWSSEVPGYYYIQPEHGSSSDSNDYGTPTAPRNSMPIPVPAGSRVEFAGASHVATGGVFKINGTGDKNNKVWVVGDPANRPSFDNFAFHLYGSYTYVEGVDVTQTANNYFITQFASSTPDIGRDTDHCMMRDMDITGWLSGGGGTAIASASSTEFVTDIIMDDVRMHDLNDITNPADVDAHCISITDFGKRIWILNCEGNDSSGSGVQVGDTSSTRQLCEDVYVAKSSFHEVRQSGVWVKQGKRIVFSQNELENVINTVHSPSKAMGGQYFVEGVWYLFNNIYDCRYGLKVASESSGAITEYYAIGNKMWHMGQGYDTLAAGSGDWETFGDTNAISLTKADTAYIIDNTIYSTISGINMSDANDNTTALVISGNIIEEVLSSDGYHFQSDTPNQNGAVLTRNQFYDSGNIVMIDSGGTYTTLSSWQTATSNSVGDQYGDPLFTAPGITDTEDFTLQVGSPCIDSSAKSAAYAIFEAEFGFAITVDNEENDRPSTSGDWDRGAIEKV